MAEVVEAGGAEWVLNVLSYPCSPRTKDRMRRARACVVGHLRFRDVNEANYETLNAAAAAAPSFPPSLLPSIAIWVTRVTRRENSRKQREV